MKIKFENYGSYRLGIRLGRFERVWHLRRPIWAIQRAIRSLREYWADLTGQSIYGIWWSRDCDMAECHTAVRFNSRKALERAYEDAAQDAEGPYGFEECSKEYWANFSGYTRDRAFEAYENGNGRSIYV